MVALANGSAELDSVVESVDERRRHEERTVAESFR